MYTWGNFSAGDGQLHRCRDWNELYDYATKNTACYKDDANSPNVEDYFGHCEDARLDGLEGAF